MPTPQGAITQVDPGVYRDAAGNYFRGTSMANAQFIGTSYGGGGGGPAAAVQPPAQAAPAGQPAPAAAGPAPIAGSGPMNQQQASDYVQQQLGQALTPAQIAEAYQKFGGDPTSMHSAADLAPVIAYFKGGGGGQPGLTGDTTTNGSPDGTKAFGAAPDPYVSQAWTGGQYTPKELPKDLQTPYQAPTWQGGDFVDPTMEQVKAGPGYQTRMDAGANVIEHSAAAKGSVLSGGTQKELAKYGQEYGANEFQTARGNAYQNYLGKYGQFQDAAAAGLGARNVNMGEYQTANAQGQQAYNNQYSQYLNDQQRQMGDYVLNTSTSRNADLDYWSRLRDMYGGGASAAAGSYKPGG